MKTINSRNLLILGGILATTVAAAGCFGGGGYSNSPYSYNDGSYSSIQNNASYYPGRSYPQNSGNANAYSAGYQNGVRADASADHHEDHTVVQHSAVTQDRNQAHTDKQLTSVAHNDSKDSQTHQTEKN
jgi:hypothetical protein